MAEKIFFCFQMTIESWSDDPDLNNGYVKIRVSKRNDKVPWMWIRWIHRLKKKGKPDYVSEAIFPICIS